jgi:hypothetical protein
MQIMNRAQLKKLWERSKTGPKFRRLLLAMLASLVWVQSKTRDQLAARELVHFILVKAGAAGRRDLKGPLAQEGW